MKQAVPKKKHSKYARAKFFLHSVRGEQRRKSASDNFWELLYVFDSVVEPETQLFALAEPEAYRTRYWFPIMVPDPDLDSDPT